MLSDRRLVLAGRVRLAHHGAAAGSWRPEHPGAIARLEAARRAHGVERLVLMRPAFSTVIARTGEVLPLAGSVSIDRMAGVADGVWLEIPAGLAIASADCATALLLGRAGLLMVHLGLRGVWRDDGRPPILERALAAMGEPAGQLRVWLGAAAGPCCHGFPERTPEQRAFVARLRARWGAVGQPGRVRHGPRRGWAACDHLAIAEAICRRAGVGRLEIERTCTACTGLADPNAPGVGRYFSHIRDPSAYRSRNLLIAGAVTIHDSRHWSALLPST